MNDIFERVTFKLSLKSKRDIQRKCSKTSVSLHDLRHTAAVNRIRSYRHSGIPQDQAESMMQAFFGWSASSRMPQHYASAFYEKQLNGPWLDKFSSHVDRISKYGK